MSVKYEEFGKDHWSLLGYIGINAIDSKGKCTLDSSRLRMKIKDRWKPEYGTRLAGYFLENNEVDASKLLPNHDDIDCLIDMEEAGLLAYTPSTYEVTLTSKGIRAVAKLFTHKMMGGMYSNFGTTIFLSPDPEEN